MNWLVFVPLPFLVAYLVKCQDQRAVQKEGSSALQDLSREDRRRVGRALLRGEAIEEARLVAPTLAWTRSMDVKCRWGDVFLAVWLGTFLVNAGLAMRVQDWKAAAIILLCFDFFALVTAVGAEAKRRAKRTELATLRRFQGTVTVAPSHARSRARSAALGLTRFDGHPRSGRTARLRRELQRVDCRQSSRHAEACRLGRGGHVEFDLEFDVADIKPGLQVQVVAGMYFDRRVFLVANTGEKRPTVIALTPHMARLIAQDLMSQSGSGEVYDLHTPVLAPVVVRLVDENGSRTVDGAPKTAPD